MTAARTYRHDKKTYSLLTVSTTSSMIDTIRSAAVSKIISGTNKKCIWYTRHEYMHTVDIDDLCDKFLSETRDKCRIIVKAIKEQKTTDNGHFFGYHPTLQHMALSFHEYQLLHPINIKDNQAEILKILSKNGHKNLNYEKGNRPNWMVVRMHIKYPWNNPTGVELIKKINEVIKRLDALT